MHSIQRGESYELFPPQQERKTTVEVFGSFPRIFPFSYNGDDNL